MRNSRGGALQAPPDLFRQADLLVFVRSAHVPTTGHRSNMHDNGYLKVKGGLTVTFNCRAVAAAGTGCRPALDAERG